MSISLDSVIQCSLGKLFRQAMGFALENSEVRPVTWLWGLGSFFLKGTKKIKIKIQKFRTPWILYKWVTLPRDKDLYMQ